MLPKYYKNEMIWKMFMSFFREPLRQRSGFLLLCTLSVCCGRSNDFFSLWWKTVANSPSPRYPLIGDKRMSFLERKKTFSPSRFRIWVFPFCKSGSTVVRITNLPRRWKGEGALLFLFFNWWSIHSFFVSIKIIPLLIPRRDSVKLSNYDVDL